MFVSFSRYAVRPASWLLVAVFAGALLWCGDPACREGAVDSECASLICALFLSHGAGDASHDAGGSAPCQCICHVPTISGDAYQAELDMRVEITVFDPASCIPPSPAYSIYHPPKA